MLSPGPSKQNEQNGTRSQDHVDKKMDDFFDRRPDTGGLKDLKQKALKRKRKARNTIETKQNISRTSSNIDSVILKDLESSDSDPETKIPEVREPIGLSDTNAYSREASLTPPPEDVYHDKRDAKLAEMSRVRSFLDSDVIDLDEDYNESSQGVNDKDLDPDLQRALKISSVATDAMDTPDDPIIVKVKRKPVETRDKIVCKLLPTSNFLPLLKTSCQKWELDIESVVLVYRNVPIRPLVTIKSMKLSRAVTLELWNKDDWDEAIHHQTVERTKLLTATAGASEKGQEQSEKIRLQIKSPDEQRYTVTMNIESTVVQLIQRYSKARSLQLRPEKIKMKLDGEVLPPTSKIADHELEDNDIIDCVW